MVISHREESHHADNVDLLHDGSSHHYREHNEGPWPTPHPDASGSYSGFEASLRPWCWLSRCLVMVNPCAPQQFLLRPS